jgi:hypothetical protein
MVKALTWHNLEGKDFVLMNGIVWGKNIRKENK